MIPLIHGALLTLLGVYPWGSGTAKPGQITGIQLSASVAAIGSAVTVTIQGDGSCGELSLDLGDGRPTTLASVTLPHVLAHAYAQAGIHTISATGAGPSKQCTGTASAPVTIKTYTDILCGQVDCGALANAIGGKSDLTTLSPGVRQALADAIARKELAGLVSSAQLGAMDLSCVKTPKIAGILLGSLITPGGPVVLWGCGFTGSPELRLVGQFPGGFVALVPDPQDPDAWGYDHFHGSIPEGITGVPDHAATLQVVTKNGASNHWDVQFTADREARLLPEGDVLADCDNSPATDDDCPRPCGLTLCGNHALWIPGGWLGHDGVSATLKNGWVYYDKHFSWRADDLDLSLAGYTFTGSATAPAAEVKWGVGFSSWVSYELKWRVKGPVGTSYK